MFDGALPTLLTTVNADLLNFATSQTVLLICGFVLVFAFGSFVVHELIKLLPLDARLELGASAAVAGNHFDSADRVSSKLQSDGFTRLGSATGKETWAKSVTDSSGVSHLEFQDVQFYKRIQK